MGYRSLIAHRHGPAGSADPFDIVSWKNQQDADDETYSHHQDFPDKPVNPLK